MKAHQQKKVLTTLQLFLSPLKLVIDFYSFLIVGLLHKTLLIATLLSQIMVCSSDMSNNSFCQYLVFIFMILEY